VEVEGDVVVGEGAGTVVSKGLIFASVGLVQPAKSTQTMSKNVVKRNRVYFMKNAFDFFDISDFRFWSNESPSFTRVLNPAAPDRTPLQRFD
jgi:hypothetical protein